MHLVAAILENGRHFEFWNFFRWLMGFIKRAISKEYVCQFWCLFPEMKDSFTYLPHYWVGFAFGLRAVPLPQADAVGFGLRWSARLSGLFTGRCCSFNLGSSSLAWLSGEPSTVFLLLCLPSGCGHPLGSLVSFVTIDRQ